jgi:hypothetical protein
MRSLTSPNGESDIRAMIGRLDEQEPWGRDLMAMQLTDEII